MDAISNTEFSPSEKIRPERGATPNQQHAPVNSGGDKNDNSPNASDEENLPALLESSTPGKIFVGGLSWQTTAAKLQEYFAVFGYVTEAIIMRDPLTQRSRGFGFITFANPQCVEQVLHIETHIIDGKRIDPKHATPPKSLPKLLGEAAGRPQQHSNNHVLQSLLCNNNGASASSSSSSTTNLGESSSSSSYKLFVGGVTQDTGADDIEMYFSRFGQVEEVILPMDQITKRHRGFGFVTFTNTDLVDQMCYLRYHTINLKRVECKRALPQVAAARSAPPLNHRGGGVNQQHGALISTTPSMARAAAAVAAAAAEAASQEYIQSRLMFDGLAGMQMFQPMVHSSPTTVQYGGGGAYQPHHPHQQMHLQQQQQQQQHQQQQHAAGALVSYPSIHNLLSVPNGGHNAAKQSFFPLQTMASFASGYGSNFRYKPYTVPSRGQQFESLQCGAAPPLPVPPVTTSLTSNQKPLPLALGSKENATSAAASVLPSMYDAQSLANAADSTRGYSDWGSIYRMGSVLPY